MKQYTFDHDGVERLYDAAVDQGINNSNEVLKAITNGQRDKIQTLRDSFMLTITLGDSTISLPATADNIELMYNMLKESLNN